jgi:hypothetical protein
MFLHHAQIQKIGKTSSLKVFWSKETKEMKQDSQNVTVGFVYSTMT